jgi:hypothetical protein
MSIPVNSYVVLCCPITSPLCPVQWLLTVVILHPELRWCRPLFCSWQPLQELLTGQQRQGLYVVYLETLRVTSNAQIGYMHTYIYIHITRTYRFIYFLSICKLYIYINAYIVSSLLVDGFGHQIFNTGSVG